MISKFIRRTHMYFALFLAPWMVMYALSTLAMNHHLLLNEWYEGEGARYEAEREAVFAAAFDDGVPIQAVAREVLNYLDMPGRFSARGSLNTRIVIERQDPVFPKRITYFPNEHKVRIEKKIHTAQTWLEEMHRRRGYEAGFLKDDVWAVLVDVVIVSMVGWVVSGLWMWWEIKAARRWGIAFLSAGAGLFAVFLILI